MSNLTSSLRVALATMAICVGGYTAVTLTVAQIVTPATANGSLLRAADGTVLGSRMVAQNFSRPEYFWPRLSAVGFDGAGAGGSNLSPAHPELATRAAARIAAEGGASVTKPIPAELVTASGSGLDPQITTRAALFQAARVAAARGMQHSELVRIITEQAKPVPLSGEGLVNVLELNLALDAALVATDPHR